MRGGLRLLAILLFKMVFGVSGPIALSTTPIEKPPTIRGPDTCIVLSFHFPKWVILYSIIVTFDVMSIYVKGVFSNIGENALCRKNGQF